MQVKKVNQYKCDFCGKKGYSSGHMRSHERYCTMNPNRVCRVCALMENETIEIASLLPILPDPKEYLHEDEYGGRAYWNLKPAVEAVMPKLRELTNNCPACIMAVLRQKGIPVLCAESFNFKEECKSIFYDNNPSNFYEPPLCA